MKRSFLEQFELSKEQINQILDENGKDLSSKDVRISQLEADLSAAKEEAESYKTKAAEAEKMENQYNESQSQLETLSNELKQQKIERALIEAGATELDYLKFKLGEVDIDSDDFSEKLATLKQDHPSFFKTDESIAKEVKDEKPSGYHVIDNKLDKGDSKPKMTKKEIMAIEDVTQRQKAIQENLDAFN
ncbi:hypothetical protein [Globicatella sp. PHS-GS-PNBC-21-1553]|uniref:phage scaffolding protein n=1 Tax=Globicatella sp. PHS-GS-PNBC-21-1553 TaxID=2885764 RepID=UPI00298F0F3D|nr:hypothetical protein [Globicatella sp. PHS-GS-PNBC-21-1553]WPC08004.1 hypothetical protein LB888_08085 [Globicatella sp. PHS-GS-PNBC-21-1553]